MIRIVAIVLCISGYPAVSFAQTIKTISATRQDWAGGIAGHYGSRYTFTIEFSGYRKEPLPDTLWIDGKPIPLELSAAKIARADEGIITCTRGKNSVRFDIRAGISNDGYAERYYPDPSGKRKEPTWHQPVPCHGVALLSYRYKGKEHYYDISKFTTIFPAVAYP